MPATSPGSRGGEADAKEHFAAAIATLRPEAPAEAAGRVVGEGDTRQGAAPMVSEEVTCPLFQPLLETGAEESMEARYRELDAALVRLRSR